MVQERRNAANSNAEVKPLSSPSGQQSMSSSALHCDGCERDCPIPPFDDLLAYGIHCMSKPEDMRPDEWFYQADLWQWLH